MEAEVARYLLPLVLQDKSVQEIKDPVIVPSDLKTGESVTIDFEHEGDNSVDGVKRITLR